MNNKLNLAVENVLIQPDNQVKLQLLPNNGYFFELSEINEYLGGMGAPYFDSNYWIFICANGLHLKYKYNSLISELVGIHTYGNAMIIHSSFLPPYFFVEGLVRNNDGTPVDGEFEDAYEDEDVLIEKETSLVNINKIPLNETIISKYSDVYLDKFNKINLLIKTLLDINENSSFNDLSETELFQIWNSINILLGNLFKTQQEEHFGHIYNRFEVFYDKNTTVYYIINDKISQYIFCHILLDLKIRIFPVIENLIEKDEYFNVLVSYIEFLKTKLETTYELPS